MSGTAESSLFVPLEGDPEDDTMPIDGDLEDIFFDEDDEGPLPDTTKQAVAELDEKKEVEGLSIEAPAYDPEFEKVRNMLKQIPVDLLGAIPKQHRQNPFFKFLVSELEKTAPCPSVPRRRINIVGRSGGGKSSLLNSLMCRHKLAKQESLGKGCTHVPTSYEAPFDGQDSAFEVRIQYFSFKDIRRKLQGFYDDYYLHKFATSDAKEEWTKDDESAAREAADTAFDSLRGLLRTRAEFSSDEEAKSWLEAASKRKSEDVVDELMEWCRELLPASSRPNPDSKKIEPDDRIPTSKFGASGQTELHDRLERYAFSKSKPEEAAVWPLVDMIRMGIRDCPILYYVTLVDWPGDGDTNELRAKASTERVADCDEIWIVTEEDRVLTNPTVWRSLGRYIDAHPCAIICTKIDRGMDEEIPSEIRDEGIDMGNLDVLGQQESELQAELKKAETELKKWEDKWQMVHANTGKAKKHSAKEVKALQARITKLEDGVSETTKRLKEVQHNRKKQVVDIRSAYFALQLQKKVEKTFAGTHNVETFFVSNTHYMGHKEVGNKPDALLTFKGTGIPSLRAHILRQASPGIFMALRHHMDSEVNLVLTGSGLTVRPEELAQCQGVLQHIMTKHERGERAKDTYFSVVKGATKKYFVDSFGGAFQGLVANAVSVVTNLRSWHPMTLKAFIRNYGDWETGTQPATNWNSNFGGKSWDIARENWELFEGQETAAIDALEKMLIRELGDVLNDATDKDAEQKLAVKNAMLRAHVDAQILHLQTICADAKTVYYKAMMKNKIEATKAGCTYSMSNFDSAMIRTYNEARDIRGKGYKQNVMNHFQARLEAKGKDSPFIESGMSAGQDITEATEARVNRIVNTFQARLTNTYKWLDVEVYGEHVDINKIMDVRAALGRKHQLGQLQLAECRQKLLEIEEKYRLRNEEKHQAEVEKAKEEAAAKSKTKTKKRKAKALD